MERNQKAKLGRLCLIWYGERNAVATHLTACKRPDTAAHNLDVWAGYPPVGVINHKAWVSSQHIIPECVQAFDPADFSNAFSLACVRSLPKGQGTDVAILAIDIDPPLLYSLGKETCHPSSGLRIAEVKEPA